MCFMFLLYFTVGSHLTVRELNLWTLESHVDFSPFTFWLRHTCTKHTRTVQSLLTTDYTFVNFSLSSQGDLNVEKSIQQQVSSWCTFYNPSSSKHAVHIKRFSIPSSSTATFSSSYYLRGHHNPLLIRPTKALDHNKQETNISKIIRALKVRMQS